MKEKQNPYKSHVVVLPEDRANEEIVNGFNNFLDLYSRAIQIERPADGWGKVVAKFKEDHVSLMRKFPKRMMVLLIDFDLREDRLTYVKDEIPEDLQDRVFILGVLSEPDDLKGINKKVESIGRGKLEKFGEALARECSNNTNELWGGDLLKHNKNELDRMIQYVKPFLFNKVNEE